MSQITVKDLTFSYENSYMEVFKDTSFQIDTDWKLGFIGRNGRGKTTFLKLLTGEYEYRGSISASVDFQYFPYEVKEPQRMTAEILEEISPQAEYWQIQKELNTLEVSEEVLYQPFDTLSHGEQTKVLLAVLFLRENLFLLIDEPTNHLDVHGRNLVAQFLNRKKGFILVSHDRVFLDQCIDHVLSIQKQQIKIEKGNYSTYYQNKTAQDHFERAKNEKLKREIGQLDAAAKRTNRWSGDVEKTKFARGNDGVKPPDRGAIGHKAAKMMKRSKAIEGRIERNIEEKSSLLKNIEDGETLKMFPRPFHSGRLAQLEDLTIAYGERTILENFSLSVNQGERICLTGRNGSGKSSIIKVLLRELQPVKGSIHLAGGLKISYVSQNTEDLSGGLQEFAAKRGIESSLLMTLLRKLDLSREELEGRIESFSEGQKKKVLPAASLCEQANLYLWDEPLNYIDIISREQIEDVILRARPTLVFVEHDIMFCDKIATRTVKL